MPAKINEAKFEERKQKLPRSLQMLLDDFFGTCWRYDLMMNWLNYQADLNSYGKAIKEYWQYSKEPEQAFNQIAGWDPSTPMEAEMTESDGTKSRSTAKEENDYQVAFAAEPVSKRLDHFRSLVNLIDHYFPSDLTGVILHL